jgi:hypothetical protein
MMQQHVDKQQEDKLLVLRLVAMQARLHGNYARVRPALPSFRQPHGLLRREMHLREFREISARAAALVVAQRAAIAHQHELFHTTVSISRNILLL